MSNKRNPGKAMMSRDAGASYAFAKLCRSGKIKPVIINVEGDSDINFYRWFTDRRVELNQNNGKSAAIEAVAIAIRANKTKTHHSTLFQGKDSPTKVPSPSNG